MQFSGDYGLIHNRKDLKGLYMHPTEYPQLLSRPIRDTAKS